MANEELQARWDRRHAEAGMAAANDPSPPAAFAHVADEFPIDGSALEVACGRGDGSVWLASRGMKVHGVDLSPVAIDLACRSAELCGVSDRCSFAVHDLDEGLPAGDLMDLVLCNLFREPTLDRALIERTKQGGLLAVCVLSEVGAGPGRFRAGPGELIAAFAELELIDSGEAEGRAWLLGRRV